MLSFVPLHQTALERQHAPVISFLETITSEEPFMLLEPRDWFLAPQDCDGLFIWTPPPALANVAIFQMAEAIHIRPWNTHVVIVPSLMKDRWEKLLNKACDFVVTLPFSDKL